MPAIKYLMHLNPQFGSSVNPAVYFAVHKVVELVGPGHVDTFDPLILESYHLFPKINSVYEERATKTWADVFNERIDKLFTASVEYYHDVDSYWMAFAILQDDEKYNSFYNLFTFVTHNGYHL